VIEEIEGRRGAIRKELLGVQAGKIGCGKGRGGVEEM
jgi:hypothetical protein